MIMIQSEIINGVRSNMTSPHLASQMFCKGILLMEEILHQLISIPLFTRFYTSQVVIAGFLNHQQYVQSKKNMFNKIYLLPIPQFWHNRKNPQKIAPLSQASRVHLYPTTLNPCRVPTSNLDAAIQPQPGETLS